MSSLDDDVLWLCGSDSEYAYEDDNDEVMSEVSEGSEMEFTEDQLGLTPLAAVKVDLPLETTQYQWTALCLRFAATYAECNYSVLDNLTVRFQVYDRILTLSVTDTKDPKLMYPNAPPHVDWSGPRLVIDQYLMITANHLLMPSSWNLCADLNAFVCRALRVMHDAADAKKEMTKVDETICKVVHTSGVSFRFDSEENEELPSLGVATAASTEHKHGYLGSNETTAKVGSLAEMLREHIRKIVAALDQLTLEYTRVLQAIVCHVLNAEITKLEAIQNEQYYRNLVAIVEKADLALDVDWLRDLLDSTMDKASNDKVFFVESFEVHTYANSIVRSKPSGKLVKRLYAEIESLVDAVKDIECYICVSETSIQLIKMLMIPDYDTPYGGGYFEFDVFVPNEYPNVPPKVQFLTTGGGSVRFNPNLYECGKVCLSVLNTWAENQWNAASSTLAQVTLSIFSMVFIEHPYTNEPCFYNALATEAGKAQSELYNARVLRDCARIAISDQVKNQSTPFVDVIKQHWRKHGDKTIEAYAKHNITIEGVAVTSSQKRNRGDRKQTVRQ